MGLLADVVDLVLPCRCAGCGRPSPAALCADCVEAAEPLALPDLGHTILDDGVAAIGVYAYAGVIAEAVRAVKLGGASAAAVGLGALMRARLRLPEPAPDLAVTWVPSTRRRQRQRGVEIPRLLAGPGATMLLRRVRERPDQTDLDRAARRASPAGSFVAVAAPPAVVLVDDVRTTGATATAAADALRAAGARRVLVATFAVSGQEARAAIAGRTRTRSASRRGSATPHPS